LGNQGILVPEKKVAQLSGSGHMAGIGIEGICGRKKVKTTRRDPQALLTTDRAERNFTANAPDELWLTEVTYIATDQGWLSLCSILDVFSPRSFAGTVLHSNHGCKYTSEAFRRRCTQLRVVQFMGTVGASYDNSMMERRSPASLNRLLPADRYRGSRAPIPTT